LSSGAFAQFGTTVTVPLWRIEADSVPWFVSANSNVRGCTYVPAGDVFVATKEAGNIGIKRINSATGAVGTDLAAPSGGFTGGGGGVLCKVVAAADGAIYACNLATSANTFKIYKWLSEADTSPQVIFNGATQANQDARCGDELQVTGTGNSTVIYAGGSGTALYKFTTDGTTWSCTKVIATFTTGIPMIAIDGTDYWLRGSTSTGVSTKYSGATNTATATTCGTSTDAAYCPIAFAVYGGKGMLGLGIGSSAATQQGKPILVYDTATAPPSTQLFNFLGTEFTGGAKANGNGVGCLTFDTARQRLYNVYTNNSVSAYTIPAGSGVNEWNLY